MAQERSGPVSAQVSKALILFGPPGSGKGTQSALLRDALGVPHVSTGEMLRAQIGAGTALGKWAELIREGSLAPDEVVNEMVEARLAKPDCAGGFILDGYPRTRPQAERLSSWLAERAASELVIHLVVDYNVIIARLSGRRQCPECGRLYNLASRPPHQDGRCDFDGRLLATREDDSETVIRRRLEAYERQTQPLIEYFRERSKPVLEIRTENRTPAELLQMIRSAIENG